MWKADDNLTKQAVQTIETADKSDAQGVLDVLEAAGTLRVVEESAPLDGAELVGAISALDTTELMTAAATIELAASRLDDESDDLRERAITEVRSALERRDRIELIIIGAELLGEVELSVEQTSDIDAFDAIVSALLFRLVPLGRHRSASIAWMSPKHRARFWWWSRGLEVPHSGLDALADAALLVHRFPEAREELEKLVSIQKELDVSLSPGATVVSLKEWVAAKTGGKRKAAASTEPTPITAFRETLHLSWREPNELIVDIVADRESESAPKLRLHPFERLVAGEKVEHTKDRFAFLLDGEALEATGADIRVPGLGVHFVRFTLDG